MILDYSRCPLRNCSDPPCQIRHPWHWILASCRDDGGEGLNDYILTLSAMNKNDPEILEQRRLGGWMYIGFWTLLFALSGMFFNQLLNHDRNPNQQVKSYVDANGVREVVLKRNRMGHYNVTGFINGRAVEFMLDTGATDIAIPASLARDLHLHRLSQMRYSTANGTVYNYTTRLNAVRVGNIVLHDLPASINSNMDNGIVLLGMSFLKKIEFSQRGDILILRQ